MALSQPPVAVILRALGLGDFLTAVPALRAIRSALPRHRLVLAAPTVLTPLVTMSRAADAVLDTSGLHVPLRCSRPAVAVNLHGRGPKSHLLLAETDPTQTVAFAQPSMGVEGPAWRSDEHEVDRWCRLVFEGMGAAPDPFDLLIEAPPATPGRDPAVVVHPGAAFRSRRWSVERYAEVARWAAAEGHDVLVTGSSDERDLAQRLCRLAGLPVTANLAGRTSLGELAAFVAHALLLVCGDTGVAHLATAFATPSVLLFGPVSPARWGPRTRGPHTVLWNGDGSGDPWSSRVDPSLAEITVDEVLESAAMALLMAR